MLINNPDFFRQLTLQSTVGETMGKAQRNLYASRGAQVHDNDPERATETLRSAVEAQHLVLEALVKQNNLAGHKLDTLV